MSRTVGQRRLNDRWVNLGALFVVITGMSVAKHAVRTVPGRPAVAPFRVLLGLAGAGLLFATAGIHLDLYLTGYRTIPTIGWLFLLQVVVAVVLGVLVLVTAVITPGQPVTRGELAGRAVALGGALFALSTLGGYLLTVQFGLFGFREVRTTAGIVAGILEVLAFAVLAWLGLAATPPGRSPARQATGSAVSGWAASGWQAGLGAAAVSVVALGLMGGALAGAGGGGGSAGASGVSSASSAASAAGVLKEASIGGQQVLTNAAGRTLYSFGPDSPVKSACNGSCAVYWPPVPGPLRAGPGVTGKLGTITRADGSAQETYNGHPLYTYIGDSGPGQDHGNKLNLNGGLWLVVPVNGSQAPGATGSRARGALAIVDELQGYVQILALQQRLHVL